MNIVINIGRHLNIISSTSLWLLSLGHLIIIVSNFLTFFPDLLDIIGVLEVVMEEVLGPLLVLERVLDLELRLRFRV